MSNIIDDTPDDPIDPAWILADAFDLISETKLNTFDYRRRLRSLPPDEIMRTVERDMKKRNIPPPKMWNMPNRPGREEEGYE